jgi:hypothetical protein
VTAVVLAVVAGVFLHVAYLERKQENAILAIAMFSGFLALAVHLVEVP